MAGRFNKLELVGSGTFGQAWLVKSRTSGRRYVVKEITVKMMTEKERQQAVNEVSILARCKHANIIRYREAFLEEGILHIVMEYAEQGDLHKRIKKEKQRGKHFKEDVILDWFAQITFALEYIHEQNILHRDLKTPNIFLTEDNIVKVGDFGIARILESTQDHAQTAIGTPYYISPEICQRKPYNQKSDMWALGCVLYEMSCLGYPFNGPDFHTLVFRIMQARYDPVPSFYGPLIHDLIAVLLRVDPKRRPSASQLLSVGNLQPCIQAYIARYEKIHKLASMRSSVSSCSSNRDSQESDSSASSRRHQSDTSVQSVRRPRGTLAAGRSSRPLSVRCQREPGNADTKSSALQDKQKLSEHITADAKQKNAIQERRKLKLSEDDQENVDPKLPKPAKVQLRKSSLTTPKAQKYTKMRQTNSESMCVDNEKRRGKVFGKDVSKVVRSPMNLREAIAKQAFRASLHKASLKSESNVALEGEATKLDVCNVETQTCESTPNEGVKFESKEYDSGYGDSGGKPRDIVNKPVDTGQQEFDETTKTAAKPLRKVSMLANKTKSTSVLESSSRKKVISSIIKRERPKICSKTYTIRKSLLPEVRNDDVIAADNDDDNDSFHDDAGDDVFVDDMDETLVAKGDNSKIASETEVKDMKKQNPNIDDMQISAQVEVARILYKIHQIQPCGKNKSVALELKEYLQQKLGQELCWKALKQVRGEVDRNTDAFHNALAVLGEQHVVYLPLILKVIDIESD